MTESLHSPDGVFDYLLLNLIAFVVDPLAPRSTERLVLRGVVRVGDERVRIVLSVGDPAAPGAAIEFSLTTGWDALDEQPVVAFLRSLTPDDVRRSVAGSRVRDSLGNIVVMAEQIGFDGSAPTGSPDLPLFSLLRVLSAGGGIPWFENVFRLSGFMITNSDRCRLYLSQSDSDTPLAVEVPFRDSAGGLLYPSTALPHELFALIRQNEIKYRPRLEEVDEYCRAIYYLGP